MRSSAWAGPAAALIIMAAITGQQIRTSELVTSARELDAKTWQIVREIVASASTGVSDRGRVFL